MLMKAKPVTLQILGGILFILGMLASLTLTSGILWGDLEAFSQETGSDGGRLHLNCPLLLSQEESSIISIRIANPTAEPVMPVIIAQISGRPPLDQTLSLEPGESQLMEWKVDASSRIFDRIIRVNVFQRRYQELEPRQGSCGILVFSLAGMPGYATYGVIFGASLALMLVGGFLWRFARAGSKKEGTAGFTHASGFLGALAVASLFSSLLRWWGLTLMLNALAVLMVGIIVSEFILHPGGKH